MSVKVTNISPERVSISDTGISLESGESIRNGVKEKGPRFVRYKGRVVREDWPARIAEAQKLTHVRLADGTVMPRVKFGDEDSRVFRCMGYGYEDGTYLCHACAAEAGEYHVPGCDVERHPGDKDVQLSAAGDVAFISAEEA